MKSEKTWYSVWCFRAWYEFGARKSTSFVWERLKLFGKKKPWFSESWEGNQNHGSSLQMMFKKDECTLSTDRKSPASSPQLSSIGAYHLRESHPKRQAKNNFRIEPLASLVRIWPFRLKHQMQLSLLQTCPSLRIIFGLWTSHLDNHPMISTTCSCWVPNVKHVKPMAFPTGNQPCVSPQLSRYTIRSRDASLRKHRNQAAKNILEGGSKNCDSSLDFWTYHDLAK